MREGDHPRLPEEAFRRFDETPDELFYSKPRFFTHIDEAAIAAVTNCTGSIFRRAAPSST